VGKRLTEARENLGASIEALAAKTRLLPDVIRRLEADDFSGLDSDVFVRAYLRSLASILHIDGDEIVAIFNQQIGATTMLQGSKPAELSGGLNVFDFSNNEVLPRKRTNTPFVIAGLLLLIGLVVAAQISLRGSDSAKPVITLSAHPTNSSEDTHSASPTNSNGVDPSIVTVVLHVNQRSWISVTASTGEKLLAANVAAGEVRAFTDTQALTVTIGNAPGVEVTVNGIALGVVGDGRTVATNNYGIGDPRATQSVSETPTPSAT
jgi:cytoskeleton protein RodZ